MTVSSLVEIEVVLKLEATRPNLTAIVEFRVRSLAASFGSSSESDSQVILLASDMSGKGI